MFKKRTYFQQPDLMDCCRSGTRTWLRTEMGLAVECRMCHETGFFVECTADSIGEPSAVEHDEARHAWNIYIWLRSHPDVDPYR